MNHDSTILASARRFTRSVICEGCGREFMSHEPDPQRCGICSDMAYQADLRAMEAEARAAGYSSSDEYIEAKMRAASP